MDDRIEMVRPTASGPEVTSKIADLYGLRVDKIKQLDGYDDLNFYIESSSETTGSSKTSGVCKILNSKDSQETKLIDSQHRLMVHLHASGLSVPRPLTNKSGGLYSLETFGQNQHVFRLLEFVPGNRLNDAQPCADLYYKVGDLIGQMYQKLKGFSDEDLKSRRSQWNLDSVPELVRYVSAVGDKNRQELVTDVVEQFQELVLPAMPLLETGVIHGDLNEHNLLVNSANDIAGVIDFGDINFAPVIFEVAISMTYMIIHANDISVGKHLLEGYQNHRNLTRLEADLLKVCVSARAAQSLTLGCYSALGAPKNDYILSSQKNGWTVLNRLRNTSDLEMKKIWGLI